MGEPLHSRNITSVEPSSYQVPKEGHGVSSLTLVGDLRCVLSFPPDCSDGVIRLIAVV